MRELIRRVILKPYLDESIGFIVSLFDTHTMRDSSHARLAYTLTTLDPSDVIFEGSDLGCSPMHAIDSDASVRALLGFLTLRIGDTDREYFADYTDRQCAFRDEHAESLSMYSFEDQSENDPVPPLECASDCPHCDH